MPPCRSISVGTQSSPATAGGARKAGAADAGGGPLLADRGGEGARSHPRTPLPGGGGVDHGPAGAAGEWGENTEALFRTPDKPRRFPLQKAGPLGAKFESRVEIGVRGR